MISPSLILFWITGLLGRGVVFPYSDSLPETANVIAAVANETANPIRAATVLTSIGFYESHFDPNARNMPSDPTPSFGVWQISNEWTPIPLTRLGQAWVAWTLVEDSLSRCGSLAMYTSGRCDRGTEEAHRREELARKLEHPIYVEPSEFTSWKR